MVGTAQEVIARRALQRWLYAEASAAICAGKVAGTSPVPGSLFYPVKIPRQGSSVEGLKFSQRPGMRLHMYISAPPCGDAAVFGFPENNAERAAGLEAGTVDREAGHTYHRTGGKLLLGSEQVLEDGGQARHGLQLAGQLRRKPGEGRDVAASRATNPIKMFLGIGLDMAASLCFSKTCVDI